VIPLCVCFYADGMVKLLQHFRPCEMFMTVCLLLTVDFLVILDGSLLVNFVNNVNSNWALQHRNIDTWNCNALHYTLSYY
jgi:hypothetical protein